ncbi:hypothetical protein [Natranaeroarchaeum aerophilus]|uniref:hypothetical protein n=1 Tax=Natranaeroarchaeum aerophilus TaxID=2917711 RepID=UPI002029F377|nr:hypothetical protein [Natranaeroarchaeum aerophilus]
MLLIVAALPLLYILAKLPQSDRSRKWQNKLFNTRGWRLTNEYVSSLAILVASHRFLAALLLAWIVIVLHIPLAPPGERVIVGAENLLTVLLTIVVAFVSATYLVQFLKYEERRRIGDTDEILSTYDRTEPFIDVSDLKVWTNGIDHPTVIPAAVEDIRVADVTDLDLKMENRYYDFRPDINAMIEPELDDLQQTFQQEGHFSGLLFRLDRISDGVFHGEKTSYYRSFVTNFCPEITLQSGKTLRELTIPLLFDNTGNLKQLAKSPLSDHLGIACLVITTNGTVFLARRSESVAVDQFSLSLPVSGSATITPNIKNEDEPTIAGFFYNEISEEMDIGESHVQQLIYLGTIRRMERLGKPDAVGIALVDAEAEWRDESGEYTKLTAYDLDVKSPLLDPSQSITPEVADEVLRTFAAEIEKHGQPSVGLLSTMYLLDQHSEPGSVSQV